VTVSGSSSGCASGWHQLSRRCFYLSKSNEKVRNFLDGEKICKSKYARAHLASIHSSTEDSYVWRKTPGEKIWLGGTDVGREGSWFWSNGSPWTYSNWGSGEPDKGERENCLLISKNKWHDVTCDGDYWTTAGYACSYDLDEDIERNKASINHLNTRMGNVESNVRSVEGRLNSRVDSKVGAAERRLDSRVNTVESKIGATDRRLDSRVNTVESKIGATERRLDTRVDTVDSKLGTMENKLNARVDTVQTNVENVKKSLNSSVEATEINIGTMNASIDTLSSNVDLIKNTMSSRVEIVKNHVAVLNDSVHALETSVDDQISEMQNAFNATKQELRRTDMSYNSKIKELSNNTKQFQTKIEASQNKLSNNVDIVKTNVSDFENTFSNYMDNVRTNVAAAVKTLNSSVIVVENKLDDMKARLDSRNCTAETCGIPTDANGNYSHSGVCAHGWQTMGLKCYYFSGQATVSTYSAGEAKCRALHPRAYLVSIHSKQENDWIADKTETYLTYIGASDRTTENVWQWSDNSTWGYTNWDLGQPDDWDNGEDCGIIHQDGTWRDIPCAGWNVGYVCSYHLEIRQPAELQNEDIESNKASIEEIRKTLNTSVDKVMKKTIGHIMKENKCAEICRAELLPKSCSDINTRKSGTYNLNVGGSTVKVYCDLEKDGGRWTVIQRRGDFGNPEDYFYRNWYNYTNGFGDTNKDHWMGLKYQNEITQAEAQQLLITLEDWEGNTTQITVNDYGISNEANKFRMDYSTVTGQYASDWAYHKGMPFTTFDNDNDRYYSNCAERYQGAWWYMTCHKSNLNGLYLRGKHKTFAIGVNTRNWKGYYYSLKKTEMKIRPMSHQAPGLIRSCSECLKCILNL